MANMKPGVNHRHRSGRKTTISNQVARRIYKVRHHEKFVCTGVHVGTAVGGRYGARMNHSPIALMCREDMVVRGTAGRGELWGGTDSSS
jgi:hypothetical protein